MTEVPYRKFMWGFWLQRVRIHDAETEDRRLEQQPRACILNHKLEAERTNSKWHEFCETSKPMPSDIFPPARPYLLIIPKEPPPGDQVAKTQ